MPPGTMLYPGFKYGCVLPTHNYIITNGLMVIVYALQLMWWVVEQLGQGCCCVTSGRAVLVCVLQLLSRGPTDAAMRPPCDP